jgi:predicted secreted protein with PEFG-CTERM motif
MKSKLIGSLFVILTLVVGIMAFAPSAFADQSVTITKGAGGSANAACVTANNCFTPNPVQVAPGETVTWTNTDSASHTVTSGKPDNSTGNIVAAVFDSSLLGPAKTFSHTFTTADVGTINYFCQVHPWMAGQVIVGTSAPTAAINATAGNNTAVPEFGSIASIVLVIAIISVVAVTAKTRGFLKL